MKKLTLIILAAFISLSAASQDWTNFETIKITKVSNEITKIESDYYYSYSVLLIVTNKQTGYPEYFPSFQRTKHFSKTVFTPNRGSYSYHVHIIAIKGNYIYDQIIEL